MSRCMYVHMEIWKYGHMEIRTSRHMDIRTCCCDVAYDYMYLVLKIHTGNVQNKKNMGNLPVFSDVHSL